ncbi:UNVERIFIED_CONTAM: hypothetical protein Slati_0447500 [Sesamum latifolium]|uniref:Uncharacterized protein n=1 Tax=Sesamum latifolium TaxID=2727402 RepID=A0AAW2XVR2_9LAMI
MKLLMDDMVSTALLHVIDAKTSYNMLLGRPWLHEKFVVPSTWHQCFKYCRNGIVRKVLGDSKPFTEAESHFADTKYYIKDDKKGKEVLPSKEPKSYNSQSSKYLCLNPREERGHKALAIDEKEFDPKAFKLLIKVEYNPKEKLSLGKLSSEATNKKLYRLNATQMMLKEKGHAIQDSRVGLGFTPPKPFRIAIKRLSRNYATEELSSTEDDKRKENSRESVFNRLGPHRRMVHETASKPYVFDRLGPCKRKIC